MGSRQQIEKRAAGIGIDIDPTRHQLLPGQYLPYQKIIPRPVVAHHQP